MISRSEFLNRPNCPGWWWYRIDPEHDWHVLEVIYDEDDGMLSVVYNGIVGYVENWDGEWFGPIKVPDGDETRSWTAMEERNDEK